MYDLFFGHIFGQFEILHDFNLSHEPISPTPNNNDNNNNKNNNKILSCGGVIGYVMDFASFNTF